MGKSKRICSVVDVDGSKCSNTVVAWGFCDKHYNRWKKHGDPLVVKNPIGVPPEARFWAKVDKAGPMPENGSIADHLQLGQCWIWTGARSISADGSRYGQIGINGKTVRAHRFSLTVHGVSLIDGLHVDHLCRRTLCVNPEHLEQVPPRINALRGVGAAAQAALKTHCPQGHEYTEENTYRPPGEDNHRQCIICIKARSKTNGMLEPVPIIPCPICGTPFKARKVKGGRKKTCSQECGRIWRWGV